MKNNLLFCFISLLAISCGPGLSSDEQQKVQLHEEEPPRLKMGLALGGGGAKAAAEIGALMVLDENKIPIDYVAGSSMGAVIGGLYAAGYTAEEIWKMWLDEDWLKLFDKNAIGSIYDKGGQDYERSIFGLIDGDVFETKLRDTLKFKNVQNFEDLKKVKFCCTATRIKGKKYLETKVFSSGDMARAIHASMCYPAPIVGFPPVEIDGQSYVDGGMLDNLPVDVVLDSMKADKVIAIDLEMKMSSKNSILFKGVQYLGKKAEELTGSEVLPIWLVEWQKGKKDVKSHRINTRRAKNNGIVVLPDLIRYNILSFGKKEARDMMNSGKLSMEGNIDRIKNMMKSPGKE